MAMASRQRMNETCGIVFLPNRTFGKLPRDATTKHTNILRFGSLGKVIDETTHVRLAIHLQWIQKRMEYHFGIRHVFGIRNEAQNHPRKPQRTHTRARTHANWLWYHWNCKTVKLASQQIMLLFIWLRKTFHYGDLSPSAAERSALVGFDT